MWNPPAKDSIGNTAAEWGCEVYVKKFIEPDKLSPKSDKCLFWSPKETKWYYFYNQSENQVFVSRDGVFLENEFISKKTSGSNIYLEEIREEKQRVKGNTLSEAARQENA